MVLTDTRVLKLFCYFTCPADPEVTSHLVGPDYEFIVIACDGKCLSLCVLLP